MHLMSSSSLHSHSDRQQTNVAKELRSHTHVLLPSQSLAKGFNVVSIMTNEV